MPRALLLAGLTILWAATAAPVAAQNDLARGEYLYRIAGCENCHTDRKNNGKPLAGGRRLETPLGVFVAPNITPDRDTGIGAWSEQDFLRALREGVSPKSEHYYPAFPYTSYTFLNDEDMRALYAYLRSVPAVNQPNKPHELPWYLRVRASLIGWKWMYFDRGPLSPQPNKSDVHNRGRYLVRAAAHCSECHTPREPLGGPAMAQYLAGTRDGPEGATAPNITPHKETGIGRWSKSDLASYLESGMTPDGDFAGEAMGEFIENGLKYLTREDRTAIAEYVFAVPPIQHQVRDSDSSDDSDDDF